MLPQSHESISLLSVAETQVERESSITTNLSPCMLLLYSYDFGARFKPSPFAPSSPKASHGNDELSSLGSLCPHQETTFSQTHSSLMNQSVFNANVKEKPKILSRPNGEDHLLLEMQCSSIPTLRKGILKFDGKYNKRSQKQRRTF